tara:strand:- start:32968 stop:33144 length:177 start_codon:yes stop_codon:yes gene_type:complete
MTPADIDIANFVDDKGDIDLSTLEALSETELSAKHGHNEKKKSAHKILFGYFGFVFGC